MSLRRASRSRPPIASAAAGYDPTDYFARFNGTSSATPHVAGVAALLLSFRPSLTNVQLRQIIESTCDKISPNLYTYRTSGPSRAERGTRRSATGASTRSAPSGGLRARRKGPQDVQRLRRRMSRGHTARVPEPGDRFRGFRTTAACTSTRRESSRRNVQERLQLRITYEHCLRMVGRQQGPLIYTLTLLPGEEVTLYEYDRYRRVRSETERVSVHTSFRQTLSALSQTRRTATASAYVESLSDAALGRTRRSRPEEGSQASSERRPYEVSSPPSWRRRSRAAGRPERSPSNSRRTRSPHPSRQRPNARSSSAGSRRLSIARRRHEGSETTTNATQSRTSSVASTRCTRPATHVESLEWRVGECPVAIGRRPRESSGRPSQAAQRLLDRAPRVSEEHRDQRSITLPTDGTLYEAELAHCSSCEPNARGGSADRLEVKRLESRSAASRWSYWPSSSNAGARSSPRGRRSRSS